MTSKRLTPDSTGEQLTFSPEDFRVSPLVLPGSEAARRMTVRSGLKCFALSKSVDPVGLWGTPRASDGIVHRLRNPGRIGNPRGRLEDQVALLPTPQAIDGDFSNMKQGTCLNREGVRSKTLATEIQKFAGGHLNPDWVESYIMGYPDAWTDLDH